MRKPAKRTLCVLLAIVLLTSACTSIMQVRYSSIPEEDIGEISFIAADEKAGKLVTGVVVEVYRQGEEKPFRTFATDARGPIRLTNLPPGKYTLRAAKYLDSQGKRRSITGDTSATLSVKAGKCNEVTQILDDNGDEVVTALIVVSVVVLVVLVLAAALSSKGSVAPGLPFFLPVPGPTAVRSRGFQDQSHHIYSYESDFYLAVDPGSPPPRHGHTMVVEHGQGQAKTFEPFSPDMPLLLVSAGSDIEDGQVTVEGSAKSVWGMREVRVEGTVAYKVPPAGDDDELVHEIEFSHTYEGIKPGRNLIHIKAVDKFDFCAERNLVVYRN